MSTFHVIFCRGSNDIWSTIETVKLNNEFSFTTKSTSFTLHVNDGSEEFIKSVTTFIGLNLDLFEIN